MRADRLKSLRTVLEETNGQLDVGGDAGARVWPSGFGAWTRHWWAGSVLASWLSWEHGRVWARPPSPCRWRNLVAARGSVVCFSFEHHNHSLLERLIIMEAAEIAGAYAVRLPEVRAAFKAPQSSNRMMAGRPTGRARSCPRRGRQGRTGRSHENETPGPTRIVRARPRG